MLDGIKACFFDMDGTIIDSMWMWKDIDIRFLGERGIELPGDLQKRIEGKSFSETAVFFKEEFALSETLEEIKSIWNDMAMEAYCNRVQLKDGVLEFLKELKAKGIHTGIATSNSLELALGCLRALDVEQYFDTVVTGCCVGVGKPAPDIYLKCASDCQVNPSDCLVFEDVMAGIESGHNAGMKVCAVYDEYSSNTDDLKKQTADYYINSFKEISI